MKKVFTLLTAAVLTLSGTVSAQTTQEGSVTKDAGYNTRTVPFNPDQVYSGSQTLYLASDMATATNSAEVYTITKLTYPFANTGSNPGAGTSTMKVYIAESDLTAMTGAVPMSEFKAVYNGTIDFANQPSNAMEITLDEPFVMHSGKGMLVAFAAQTPEYIGSINFQDAWNSAQSKSSVAYVSASDPCDFTSMNAPENVSVGLTITYYEGEPQQGGGDEMQVVLGETKTGWVLEGTGSASGAPVAMGYPRYSTSQTLYPASELAALVGDLENYRITQLVYPVTTQATIENFYSDVKVYAAITDLENLNTPLTDEDFTQVYEGQISYYTDEVVIDLATPIDMKAGQNLVIGFISENNSIAVTGGAKFGAKYMSGDARLKYAANTTPRTLSQATSKGGDIPALKVAYCEVSYKPVDPPTPPVKTFDLSPVSITGPAKVSMGKTIDVSVKVENLGEATAEGYTVAILDSNNEKVAEITDGPAILGGLSATVSTTLEMKEVGTFTYKAEVTLDGDTDETNNVTETAYTVEVVDKGFLPNPSEVMIPAESTGTTHNMFNLEQAYSGSQIIYPASYFDFTREVQLQKVGVTLMNHDANIGPKPVKIWFAQVDRTEQFSADITKYSTDASDLVPADEFTLVYDGEFNAPYAGESETLVNLELEAPYVLQPGKALVVNVLATSEEGTPSPWLKATSTGEDCYMITYATWRDVDIYGACESDGVNKYRSMTIPQLQLTYALAPLPEKTDLAVESVTLPEEVTAGEKATFKVSIKNEGTVDVESLKVELLDMSGNEPAVLATEEVERLVAAEAVTNVNLKYTFETAGEYKVAVRVTTEGDEVAENNVSETYDVTVKDAFVAVVDLAAVSITGETKGVEGSQQEYTVTVRNDGNVAVDTYKVEILNGETVMASKDVTEAIAAEATAEVKLTVTLPSSTGVITLRARVTAADDNKADNNEATLYVDVTTSIAEILGDAAFAYANGVFYVGDGVKALQVVDMAGRVVLSANVNAPATVPFNGSGVYVVKAVTADGVKTMKLNIR